MSPPAYSQAATGICDLGLSPDAANPHSVADSFASSAILPGSSLNSAIVDSVVHDMSSHPIASSSNVSKPTPTRRLQFTIEHRDRTQPIFISDSDTVGEYTEANLWICVLVFNLFEGWGLNTCLVLIWFIDDWIYSCCSKSKMSPFKSYLNLQPELTGNDNNSC